MNVLRQCGAKDHLPVAGNSRQLHRRIARPDNPDTLEIEPETLRTNRSVFLEDFIVEHSLAGLQIAPIEMAGSF